MKHRWAVLSLVAGLVGGANAAVVEAKVQTQHTPGGMMRVLVDSKLSKKLLPLAKTTVTARITGHTAQVAVQQRFNNPFTKALEAIYVFPLPQNAAVSTMRITIGGRTITSMVKSRAEARKIYDAAKRAGKTVAHLAQERPNVFTQMVANIAPGTAVQVELVYDVELRLNHQAYEFVYPMVVGPRYIPGKPTGKPTTGGGRSPDTTRVPDASRITPPIVKPGARSGHNISVEVTIDPGVAMKSPTSPTHTISVVSAQDPKRPHAVIVRLAKADRVPNKDLVVRYRLATAKAAVAVIAHRGRRGGFFTLVAHPPARLKIADVTAKELVFVVDTTGSMAGEPLAMMKRAMRYSLRHLNRNDSFQIIVMTTGTSTLGNTPLANTPANIRRALSFINGLSAGGSSGMLAGIRASLTPRASAKRLRIVSFMTDGFVGNDVEVLAAVTKLLGPRTRLFPMGLGSSVNRSLLERMAALGRGSVHYTLLREKPEVQVKRFYARLSSPVLTNITIDWKGLDVKDLVPAPIPDVFAGRPLQVVGRYDRAGEATIVVRGKYAGKDVSFSVPVALPGVADGHGALGRLWARARIRHQMAVTFGKRTTTDIAAIRALATKFGLVSKYTSLVALDKRPVNPGGKVRTYYVPVEMPEGVSYGASQRDGAGGTVTSAIGKDATTDDRSGGTARKSPPTAGTSSIEMVALARRQPGLWHFEAGLSSGIVAQEGGAGNQLQAQLNLHAARVLTTNARIGLDLMVFLPDLGSTGGGAQLTVRAGYLALLEGKLELGGGLGLAFPFDDKVGVAFLATGAYQLPAIGRIQPLLQLRYEGNHVPLSGNDMRSFTVGAGFGF